MTKFFSPQSPVSTIKAALAMRGLSQVSITGRVIEVNYKYFASEATNACKRLEVLHSQLNSLSVNYSKYILPIPADTVLLTNYLHVFSLTNKLCNKP